MIEILKQAIPFIPWLVLAFLGLLAFAGFVIHKRATDNPADTWEDDFDRAFPKIQNAAFAGADWLGLALASKGETKLKTAMDLIKKIEPLWRGGKKTEALTVLMAFLWDARSKVESLPGGVGLDYLAGKLDNALKNPPPATLPIPGPKAGEPSKVQ